MRNRSLILNDCLDGLNDMQPEDRKFHLNDRLILEVLVDIRDILQKALKIGEILAIKTSRTL